MLEVGRGRGQGGGGGGGGGGNWGKKTEGEKRKKWKERKTTETGGIELLSCTHSSGAFCSGVKCLTRGLL